MSKKLIEGLRVLLLDVKVGHAALMKQEKQAANLARRLVSCHLGLLVWLHE